MPASVSEWNNLLCYLLLIILLSLTVKMLHSAFQFYSFSHCTVHFPPLPPPLILSSPFSSEQGIDSIEGGGGRAKGVQS